MHGYNNDTVLYDWPVKIIVYSFKGCNDNDNLFKIMNSFSLGI